jgi:epoxyqueuosine reductase QueG
MNSGVSADGLRDRIKSLAGASTADLVGIAPGEVFSGEELGELGSSFGRVRSVIVLGQRVVDAVQLVRLHSGGSYRDSRIAVSFGDAMLRDACWRIVQILGEAGRAAAIPRNLRYGVDEPRHNVSYKKAAVLAGFGAIGRSKLLIHPEWGPWLLLRTVVTDAPLAPDERLDFSPCDGCRLCVEACPGGALSGDTFDRAACERFYASVVEAAGSAFRISPLGKVNCEECLRACPIGTAPARLQARGRQR